jgi:tRNA (guanine26-N2/guanine27-N2)-dimethyltransferase
MLERVASDLKEVLGSPLSTYREGNIEFLAPVIKSVVTASDVVFYNPRMEFSRDVSVCMVDAYHNITRDEMDLCEPLTSSGVRAIRWAREVPGVRMVLSGDLNPRAVFLANVNAYLNGVSNKVEVKWSEANLLLDDCLSRGRTFDVVDVDPFGSPIRFVGSAIKVLKEDGGLLCLTATDMQPLCGIHQDACLRKYGGTSLRTEYCHEIAIRLLIGAAVRIATENGLGLRVVFSHSSDHYIRAYMLMQRNATTSQENLREMGYVLHCFNCGNRKIVRSLLPIKNQECEVCGSKMRLGGPLWCGQIWSRPFVEAARNAACELKRDLNRRLIRMLDLILDELDGPPTYYDLHSISDSEGVNSPSTSRVVGLLRNRGFFASQTHFRGTCVRTTADMPTLRSIVRQLG